ncbi:Piwi domain-containing protein [Clohesyomyces aquaticus]|uniref:Piwi domain-containing protein n=1 Tax=Clohesyomyces aquaticus TaxID=1231657 RepID=A0A1Y1ZB81_9PLEO|nr:Piwi domain-containing protein [Clohesyomyces aquaticus]
MGEVKDYMENVMVKVNLKRVGINYNVEGVDLSKTMVIGADVVHPSPGAFDGYPSIAAIVGSVDNTVRKCLGSVRVQDVNKRDHEIKERVAGRLQPWMTEKEKKQGLNRLRANTIYYRDGVSEGQYQKVSDVEIDAIQPLTEQ